MQCSVGTLREANGQGGLCFVLCWSSVGSKYIHKPWQTSCIVDSGSVPVKRSETLKDLHSWYMQMECAGLTWGTSRAGVSWSVFAPGTPPPSLPDSPWPPCTLSYTGIGSRGPVAAPITSLKIHLANIIEKNLICHSRACLQTGLN